MRRRTDPHAVPDDLAEYDHARWEPPETKSASAQHVYYDALRMAGVDDDTARHLFSIAVIKTMRGQL